MSVMRKRRKKRIIKCSCRSSHLPAPLHHLLWGEATQTKKNHREERKKQVNSLRFF
jgi:hypothetical protein